MKLQDVKNLPTTQIKTMNNTSFKSLKNLNKLEREFWNTRNHDTKELVIKIVNSKDSFDTKCLTVLRSGFWDELLKTQDINLIKKAIKRKDFNINVTSNYPEIYPNALFRAADFGKNFFKEFLQREDIKFEQKNFYGDTILSIAQNRDWKEIVEIIKTKMNI